MKEPIAQTKAYILRPARYAQKSVALTTLDGRDGIKGRAARLAEGLNAKYSNRERAYIMSEAKGRKFVALFESGAEAHLRFKSVYDASYEIDSSPIKKRAPRRTTGMGKSTASPRRRLDCTLPARQLYSVAHYTCGTAYITPDPKGRHQMEDAQELADLENRISRVYAGREQIGHVKFPVPGEKGAYVAHSYVPSAPAAGKEFADLSEATLWVRETRREAFARCGKVQPELASR